ncbi:MAG: response regulator transcription factor [Clostridiales bacterium]|jgi:two-component system response regulator VicR|nr:response regulator transcription factor [Clostridiales bacterium]
MDKKLLIVEDEKSILDILSFNLKREGYDTIEAMDGETGLAMAKTVNPDLILLDVMLPKLDGFEVCRKLREEGRSTPVIMLTAREEESDKVMGLEIGADDYITKPFSMRELLARIKANIRRSKMDESASAPVANGERIVAGNLIIDLNRLEVLKNNEPVDLTQREFELLRFLASSPNKVFSREELMEKVWNYEYYGDIRTVDVTIRRLREKVEDDPANPVYIVTRRGAGYFFTEA